MSETLIRELYQISKNTGYNRIQCFGIIADKTDGVVIRCPPIAHWARGLYTKDVLTYYKCCLVLREIETNIQLVSTYKEVLY